MKFKQNVQRINKEHVVLLSTLQKKFTCIHFLDIQICILSHAPSISPSKYLYMCLCRSALLNVVANNFLF